MTDTFWLRLEVAALQVVVEQLRAGPLPANDESKDTYWEKIKEGNC